MSFDIGRFSVIANTVDILKGVAEKAVGKSEALDSLAAMAKVGGGVLTGDYFAVADGGYEFVKVLLTDPPVENMTSHAATCAGMSPHAAEKLEQGWARPTCGEASVLRDTARGGGCQPSRFDGLSIEALIEEMMYAALADVEGEMLDTARKLESAQAKARGTDADSAERADADKLALKFQSLSQKRQAMFQMISTFSANNHELAKVALANMGKA